jgi:hypothetical protein
MVNESENDQHCKYDIDGSEMNTASAYASSLTNVTSSTNTATPHTLDFYEQFEWGGVEIEIGLPKGANEMSERRTIIVTALGPLETC